MAIEIERKFLLAGEGWRPGVRSSRRLRQFYLSREGPSSVRVRIEDEARAWLTIKTARSGRERDEYEYMIPLEDALGMMSLAEGSVIDKVRHIVPHAGHEWEIDVFVGENEGLVIAEVELAEADTRLELPPWVGAEVTEDRRYYNASLANRPFRRW